jgi:hypothetical protein
VVKRVGTNAIHSGKPLTKRKSVFHFGEVPLEGFRLVRWFISHGRCSEEDRACGKKSGFEEIEGLTLDQVINDPTWSWVVEDIYARAKELVERIDHARGRKD